MLLATKVLACLHKLPRGEGISVSPTELAKNSGADAQVNQYTTLEIVQACSTNLSITVSIIVLFHTIDLLERKFLPLLDYDWLSGVG